MAKEIQKKAGVSGNSVAGKSFQIFTVSEELLAKVVEAVQAGEKEARSSGNIQSFEVFCHGFRANISLGRIMVVPAKVCNDKTNFPTALLHGALVRVFGTGGEEIADLVEKKIGGSEFDEYSQADFDTIKKELFVDVRTGEEASLVVFAPNWMNSREYICFHFSDNEEELKNNLRHQVFSAYYNPSVSSAFNALMTNVDTTKVDVTDITPKLSYPFLTENPLKQFPQLEKQAGYKKATILLNKKTADDITKQTLDPQELDVFDALDTALSNSLLPSADGAQGEGGFTAPESKPGVPREASVKVAHMDADGVCSGCKKTGNECSCSDCNCKSASQTKVAYVSHCPGHRNSKGDKAEWCIKQHNTNKILESFGSEEAAKAGLRNMESHKGSVENAPHETPFTNVGPGSAAHAEQEASAPAMKETVGEDNPEHRMMDGDPIGIAIDETGVPRSKTEEEKKASDKNARRVVNPHPEKDGFDTRGERIDSNLASTNLTDAYAKKFSGGYLSKHDLHPKEAERYIKATTQPDTYSPSSVADHAKEIKAGGYGDNPLNRTANEKWGSANIPVNFKRSGKEIMADYIADVVAAEIDDPSEAVSTKSAAARAKKESLLDKFRPKMAVELDIDSIWDAITEDMGPAPLVDIESDPSNPNPSNTEDQGGWNEDTAENEGAGAQEGEGAPQGRPNKKDVQDLPEAFRSTEPEEEKEISDSEAESQETDLENSATEEENYHGASVDSKYADFIGEVADDIEGEEELPRMHCDQCQMMSINGHAVHEQGCPNDGARWDAENGMWVKQRECFECGMEVDYDDPCCSAPVEDEADEARFGSVTAKGDRMMEANKAEGAGELHGHDHYERGSCKSAPACKPKKSKQADTADNGYDIDKAPSPSTKENGPSDTVECHQDYNTEQSEGTDRPKPEAGADIKQAGGYKRVYEDEHEDEYKREEETAKLNEGHRREYMIHNIKKGDRVTILVPAGIGRGGQEWKEATGIATMPSALKGGWVLNMGGQYGTPGVANENNIVKVQSASKPTASKSAGTPNEDAADEGCKHEWRKDGTCACGARRGKKGADISGDAAEAKAETVSPDTVDKDIQQPTVSVEEAGKKTADEMEEHVPSWVDRHSITCHNCGELADEREAIRLEEGELCARCAKEHPELVPQQDFEQEFMDGPNDPEGYAKRVHELEQEGLTTSDAQAVADAEFQKRGGKTAGTWMNRYEVEEALHILGNDPVLGKAVRFLRDFVEEVDSHSDGWSSWPLPGRAAGQLMSLIQAGVAKRRGYGRSDEPEIVIDDRAIAKAMAPIKSFMTRRGLAAGMEMPKFAASSHCPDCGEPLDLDHAGCKGVVKDDEKGGWKAASDISGDMSEAKSEVDYNKADVADNSDATDTVNPEHFATIGERNDDVPVSQGDIPSEKQPKSDLSGVQPEAHDVPPQVDSKVACGESQPESIEFDFGAGDLADIVLVEDTEEE